MGFRLFSFDSFFNFVFSLRDLLLLILGVVDLPHIVTTAHAAEAVGQVRADTRARRLGRLHTARIETCDDLVDAHHVRNGWAAVHVSGPHVALEEARREAVRYALKDVSPLENLTERCVIHVDLLPLCCRVGAEKDCVAVLAVRLRDGGLESRKEAVLCVAEDVAPDGPAAVVEALLVEDEVALDDELAERLDLVGEHLGFCAESGLLSDYRCGYLESCHL